MLLSVVIPNILGFNIIFYTRYWNQKVTETHEKFASHSNYTLAARFQAKENIKSFQMIQMVIVAGMGIVALGVTTAVLLLFNVFPQLDSLFNGIIQGEMSFTPLILTMSVINSVSSFRKVEVFNFGLLEKLKIGRGKVGIIVVRKDSSIKNELVRKETETYFNQLANSWT